MAIQTGVNVSKSTAYAVTDVPAGSGVSKGVAYAVTDVPAGAIVAKAVAYAVVEIPDLNVSKLNTYAVLTPPVGLNASKVVAYAVLASPTIDEFATAVAVASVSGADSVNPVETANVSAVATVQATDTVGTAGNADEILTVSASATVRAADVVISPQALIPTIYLQHSDGTVEMLKIAWAADSRRIIVATAPKLPLVVDREKPQARFAIGLPPAGRQDFCAFLVQEKSSKENNFTSIIKAIDYNPSYYINDLDYPSEEQSALFDMDTILIRYLWTADNGINLNSRTSIKVPNLVSEVVGPGLSTDTAYLRLVGDNTSNTGPESVIVNVSDLKTNYPGSPQFQIRAAAYWAGQSYTAGKDARCQVQIQGWKGGVWNKVGFDWSNFGGVPLGTAVSVTKTLASDNDALGTLIEDIASVTFDTLTGILSLYPV